MLFEPILTLFGIHRHLSFFVVTFRIRGSGNTNTILLDKSQKSCSRLNSLHNRQKEGKERGKEMGSILKDYFQFSINFQVSLKHLVLLKENAKVNEILSLDLLSPRSPSFTFLLLISFWSEHVPQIYSYQKIFLFKDFSK